jgi:hypothetical protein
MTQIAITTQIEAIKSVTVEALKTKESARKFLIDAGIIRAKNQNSLQGNTKK